MTQKSTVHGYEVNEGIRSLLYLFKTGTTHKKKQNKKKSHETGIDDLSQVIAPVVPGQVRNDGERKLKS